MTEEQKNKVKITFPLDYFKVRGRIWRWFSRQWERKTDSIQASPEWFPPTPLLFPIGSAE